MNWTTKRVLGIYSKTKCRICFGGHRYDKAYTDCFAPTVNFTSVLMILCLGTMLGWFFGSIDYSQAYLNADIDELCIMRAPEFLREYDANGDLIGNKTNGCYDQKSIPGGGVDNQCNSIYINEADNFFPWSKYSGSIIVIPEIDR